MSSSPHDPQSSDLSVESQGNPPIMHEIRDTEVGTYTGQCKWFSDKLGYGFVTVIKDSELKGKDIFVHHSGIKPLNSHYKTLKKGEYVNFNVIEGDNGIQAVDITGIAGGSLMCDIMPLRRTTTPPPGSPGGYANMLPPPLLRPCLFPYT